MYKKLIKIRKEKNITIYDIANTININPVHYYLIENGKRKLYYDTAIKISSVFNMKPDDIFYTKN